MEATSDALRHETRPFGVHVSLIQAGLVRTNFGPSAADRRTTNGDEAYAGYNEKIAETAKHWESGPTAKLACRPEDVAETIKKALEADHPRARYRVAPSASLMLTTRKLLPDAAFDAVVRSQFPSPEPSKG
jgi:short-subunit dehydrogenase